VTCAPSHDGTGEIMGGIAIVRDITERKCRDQLDKKHLDQLAHVTRLGLMGEMATGLAHEVNQPLTAIANYTQVSINLLKKETPDLIKLAEIAVKTQDQALKAGQIIHGVKRFCKATSQQRVAIDINELINDCVSLCSDPLKQNSIKLTLNLTDNLPLILIDHIQIEQVILNLIRNGIDAILSPSEKKLRHIIIQSYLTPNNEIQVRVKDNGSGIEEDQQAQILMPFHTTKSDGMGMGLSICRSLIEAHNGTLHFNSQFGKGSTFYFTLPI
jgi:C4-dicarboxylate-specific signal transduction histidine kinase